MSEFLQTEELHIQEKLPAKQVIGYLAGMIPTVLFVGFFNYGYSKFFLDDLQLQPFFWFLGLAIYGVFNAINDPILGYISDNTDAKKWGSRRLIFIKWGAPLLSLAFLLIWWMPTDHGSQFLLFLHFTITLCFYDTLMTMVIMNWLSLLPDMTMDVDERTKVNFYSQIIVILLGLPLLAVSTLSFEQIRLASLLVAGISPIAYFFVIKFCKEKTEFHHDESVPFWQAIKLTLANRANMCVIGLNFLDKLSSTMTSAFTFLFWFLINENNLLWYFLAHVIMGYVASFIAIRLREKFGMVNLMVLSAGFKFVGGTLIFLMVLNPDYNWLIWVGILWNSFFNGATIFRATLQMLAIDQDELLSGQRREGMFYGVNALLVKPAESFGPAVGTAILLAFAYIQGVPAESQPDSVFVGIKVVFLLIPALISLLSIILLQLYPLKGDQLKDLQKQLKDKHLEKRQALAMADAIPVDTHSTI